MPDKKPLNEPPPNTCVRALLDGEQDAFLALLTGWPFGDGRRGDEFFARPIEHDPAFLISDVFGVFSEERLVSCCQIFPRLMRIAGEPVEIGGIGAVFTHQGSRGQGLAPLVIDAALSEMRRRKYDVAMLNGARFDWYAAMGFERWGSGKGQLQLGHALAEPSLLGPSLVIEKFHSDQHLDQVKSLAAAYSADRHGTLIRDEDAWIASLALAGNPVEEFVVARDPDVDQITAYLRGCVLGESWQLLEWACAGGHESHLAELIATSLRTVGQTSVLAPRVADRRLEQCLADRGLTEVGLAPQSAEWMLQCLNTEALCKRFGIPEHIAIDRGQSGVLHVVMPPPAFHFWTADRF